MFRIKGCLVLFIGMALVQTRVLGSPVLPTDVSDRRMATEILWKGFKQLKPEERPRIILVLGGGGARGLSHIGVLRVFEEEEIPIDEIVGVSVGALIGALYSAGLSVDKIDSMAKEVGWDKLTDYSRVTMFRLVFSEDLLSTSAMETYLNNYIGEKNFSDLNIPFACVATDIRNGDRIVFREGPVAIAARASATIPAVFAPVEYRHRLLVDGGLVDNLPTGEVGPESQGEENIVVGVLPKFDFPTVEKTSVFQSLLRSIEIQKEIIQQEKKRTADFMIEPYVGETSLVDLARSRECIEAGTLAARRSALELKKLILEKTYSKRLSQPGLR